MRKRKAFTLVEIIIVVTIIALLALVAIGNYGAARQQAKMDIIVDTLISALKEKQSLARSGRGGDTPQCYGLLLQTGAPYVQELIAPYVSVNPDIDSTRVDFCDMSEWSVKKTTFDLLENYKISSIDQFGTPASTFVIMFRPPEGRISIGNNLNNIEPLGVTASPLITIKVTSANGKDNKAFTYDVTSGVTEVFKQQTAIPAI